MNSFSKSRDLRWHKRRSLDFDIMGTKLLMGIGSENRSSKFEIFADSHGGTPGKGDRA